MRLLCALGRHGRFGRPRATHIASNGAAKSNTTSSAQPAGARPDPKKLELSGAYDPAYVESHWYSWWEAAGVFRRPPDVVQGPKRPQYTALFPPANVTGQLHIGHALTCTLEDVLVRWRRMSGDRVWWIPGTDHAGIATQTVVERRLWTTERRTRHDAGREEFLKAVWAWKEQYGGRINVQLRRLGASLDWSSEYFTMDAERSDFVKEAFLRLHSAGLVYRATRMISWCCHLRTVISDIEIESRPIPGRTFLQLPGRASPVVVGVLYQIAYPLIDATGQATSEPPVVVATTRPETILGDCALAVHPDDERYRSLQGRSVKNPITGEQLPIVTSARLVDRDLGTGIVKLTPAHDFADHEAALELGLAHNARDILLDDGTMSEAVPNKFRGLDRFAAREAVLARLTHSGHLLGQVDQPTVLSLCSRSGDLLEPRLKPQWFVAMDAPSRSALSAMETGALSFVPPNFASEWRRWLTQARDWCISRQLWWGHRIPAYQLVLRDQERGDKSAGVPWQELPVAVRAALHDAVSTSQNAALVSDPAHLGLDTPLGSERASQSSAKASVAEPPWFVAASKSEAEVVAASAWSVAMRLAGANAATLQKYHWALEQDSDVLDTWFSSALLPLSATASACETPAMRLARATEEGVPPLAFLETGSDILFFWVARMVMLCSHLSGVLPFDRVLLHSVVRDSQGRKMSKSLGNVVDPVDVMDGISLERMVKQLESAALPSAEIQQGVAELRKKFPSGIPPCGADALRLTLAQYPQHSHFLNLDLSRIVTARLFGNKLWNAVKFTHGLLSRCEPKSISWTPATPGAPPLPSSEIVANHRNEALTSAVPEPSPEKGTEIQVLDRWLFHRLSVTAEIAERGLTDFEINRAVDAITDWFYHDLCDFYIETCKERSGDDLLRAITALACALDTGLRLLHPFMPFLTQHLWYALLNHPAVGDAVRQQSEQPLPLATFPLAKALQRYSDEPASDVVNRARGVLHAVRSLRQNLGLPVSDPASFSIACEGSERQKALEPLIPLLGRMARANSLGLGETVTGRCTSSTLVDMYTVVAVDLGELGNAQAVLDRLETRHRSLERTLAGLLARQADTHYRARVPEAVQRKDDEHRRQLLKDRRQLQIDLDALKSLQKGRTAASPLP